MPVSVDFVIRMADNIHVLCDGEWRNILEVAREKPAIGLVVWREEGQKPVSCRAVAFRARLREADDLQEPNPEVNFVVLSPVTGSGEPLILATSLPVETLEEVRAVVRMYEYRWAIETMFEALKRDWHIDEFMVRHWRAIERLLWAGAMAYMVLLLLLLDVQEESRQFLEEVRQFWRRRAVMGKDLGAGKLREALALDRADHFEDWLLLFRGVT